MIQPPIVLHPDRRKQCRCTVMKHTVIMASSGRRDEPQRLEQCACADSRDERARAKGA